MDSPLRVLIDNREKHWAQNPFVLLWSQSLDPDIKLTPFTWRRALFGRYDIVHFNWPEYLFIYSHPLKHIIGWVLTYGLITRMRLQKKPYIRSFHDLSPWVQVSSLDRMLINLLDNQVSHVVYLTDPQKLGATYRPALEGKPVSLIKHPEYEFDEDLSYDLQRHPHSEPPYLLCFGILRPYKSYETVIDAFLQLDQASNMRLKIMGAAPDVQYLESLRRRADKSPLIELRAGRLSEEVLIAEILAARCVVVPYENLYNSGVVFLSLSLRVPVLLRAGPVASELRDEYGDDLIVTFDERIEPADLKSVFQLPRSLKSSAPIERTWTYAGRKYSALYRGVCGRVIQNPEGDE